MRCIQSLFHNDLKRCEKYQWKTKHFKKFNNYYRFKDFMRVQNVKESSNGFKPSLVVSTTHFYNTNIQIMLNIQNQIAGMRCACFHFYKLTNNRIESTSKLYALSTHILKNLKCQYWGSLICIIRLRLVLQIEQSFCKMHHFNITSATPSFKTFSHKALIAKHW